MLYNTKLNEELYMDYTWEKLSSREFEIIACNFAGDMFPGYEWKLTANTRDYNHDFFAKTEKLDKWGEAKHSEHAKKTMSRTQWDPTLVSAKLMNSVNDILLITCAYIPLQYIIRAFHMISSPIDNIYCINRYLLNEWFHENNQTTLLDFDPNFSINSFLSKITINNNNFVSNNDIQLYIFDASEKNYLTIINDISLNNNYNLNVAIFCIEDKAELNIDLGIDVSRIGNINVINMSFKNKSCDVLQNDNQHIKCNISKGYSIVTFDIMVIDTNRDQKETYINYSIGKIEKTKKLQILKTNEYDDNLLINLEKEIKNNKKHIIETEYIPRFLLKRPDYQLCFLHFDCRCRNNFTQLCRMYALFITGIDFQGMDEETVKQTLYLGNYPLWLENIILGVFSDAISNKIIQNSFKLINNYSNFIPNKTIYVLENVQILNNAEWEIIKNFEYLIETKSKDNIIIYQKHSNILKQDINEEIALISIFETGINCNYLNENNIKNNKLAIMDIDKKLYYPSNDIQFNNIITYFIDKTEEEKHVFINKIIDISSKQIWTSRVFDFILICENKISNKIYFDIIRSLRDIFYNRTDFFSAYNYSVLLHKDTNVNDNIMIDDMYKEADELNHCGSIRKSKELFQQVSNLALEMNEVRIGIEALTEVYNIRFWLLDVNDLEVEIDKTLDKYFINKKTKSMKGRELYPYYNCLNRKMVTQYLLNKYEDAEITFKEILNKTKLNNYIAFAYMDSARGLYNKDISTAYERIKKATEYLENLFQKGDEIRRYYDCLIEKAYIEFIIANNENRKIEIKQLKNTIYDATKYGFKNIVEKSYFKLAACYLVLSDLEKSKEYLDKIKNNPYFDNSPKNQIMYNDLMEGYFHLLNVRLGNALNISSDFCEFSNCINFKCFDNKVDNCFYIDGRMW